MDELNGLFDRDDVAREVRVDVVNQRRKRRGLSRTCGAGDQHEAAAHVAKFLHDRRDAELFERHDFRGNQTEHAAEAVGLLQVIAAEARRLVHLVGEIEIAGFHKASPAIRPRDFAHHVGHFLLRERFVANRHDGSVLANLRRLALTEVKVGGASFHENVEKLIDVGHW